MGLSPGSIWRVDAQGTFSYKAIWAGKQPSPPRQAVEELMAKATLPPTVITFDTVSGCNNGKDGYRKYRCDHNEIVIALVRLRSNRASAKTERNEYDCQYAKDNRHHDQLDLSSVQGHVGS